MSPKALANTVAGRPDQRGAASGGGSRASSIQYRWRTKMVRVVGIDHLVIRVGDFEKSKAFYARLFEFLGFDVEGEYEDAIGWANGKTLFWIGRADAEGRRRKYRVGDVGFHHYAFQLPTRKDVDRLEAFLKHPGATLVHPARGGYDGYYPAVL